ncbi:MAG: replication-associated recombination protein A [Bacteroidia bacterium]
MAKLSFSSQPMAQRMRPASMEDYVGQEHLVGTGSVMRKAIESGRIPSMILWGPPGVGKTTLAEIIAKYIKAPFYQLSAINSGVKDVRNGIEEAGNYLSENPEKINPVLFIDEIHRFSKSQQDSLLGAVERGIITLIGATTENPSFEVISPLLSRCNVYILKELNKDQLIEILKKAIAKDHLFMDKKIILKETEALLRLSGGDARKLLNLFELVAGAETDKDEIIINDRKVMDFAQQNIALYDKGGEQHYNIISAFIKSIRGSDPNAAVYYLARMIAGGEDISFIARRLVILASEDIGNANPTALVIANNCFQAVNVIGWPESRIILSQCITYLAASPKSNAAYMAINAAQETVEKTGDLPVPLHIRNAPTKLMKEIGYGKNYQYDHSYESHFAAQEFLPEKIKGKKFYDPGNNARENEMRQYLRNLWKDKYGY